MITPQIYTGLRDYLVSHGYAEQISFYLQPRSCESAVHLIWEWMWVVLNGGKTAKAARTIFRRVQEAIIAGDDVGEVFGNRRFLSALGTMRATFRDKYAEYLLQGSDVDKLAFLETLPLCGEANSRFLAKNFGLEVCKPDMHLKRLAKAEGVTPQELCEALARETGDPVALVDYVLYQAAALGWI